MSALIDRNKILNEFQIKSLEELENKVDNLAPSLAEYTVRNLLEYYGEDVYLDYSNIQFTFQVSDINIFVDYSNNCYIVDNVPTDDFKESVLV